MSNPTHFIEVSKWYGAVSQSNRPIPISQFSKVLYSTRCASAETIAIFYITPKPDNREYPCENCETGEYIQIGFTQPNGQTNYECNECSDTVSFP